MQLADANRCRPLGLFGCVTRVNDVRRRWSTRLSAALVGE